MNNIENMTKEELIEFTKNYNIFRCYDFPDFLETKNQVLKRLEQLDISLDEINFIRICDPDIKTIRIY